MTNSTDDFERLLVADDRSWYYWLWDGHSDEWTVISETLRARTVHTVGGHEGGGENVEIVVEVEQYGMDQVDTWDTPSRYFEKLGYYGSYYGCDFDGSFTEVFPQQKTITVYEKE